MNRSYEWLVTWCSVGMMLAASVVMHRGPLTPVGTVVFLVVVGSAIGAAHLAWRQGGQR